MRISRPNFAILLLTTTFYSGVSRSSSADPNPASSSPTTSKPVEKSTTKLPKELEGKVAKLKKGQRAPTKGILMTRATLARLITESDRRIQTAVASARLAVKNATDRVLAAEARAAAEVAAAKSGTEACLADALRRERIYENALAKGVGSAAWWRSPLFVGAVGAVVGGGICVGATAASR